MPPIHFPMKIMLDSSMSCLCEDVRTYLDETVFESVPYKMSDVGTFSLANGDLVAMMIQNELAPLTIFDNGFAADSIEIEVSNEVMELDQIEQIAHLDHDQGPINAGDAINSTHYTALIQISAGKFFKIKLSGNYIRAIWMKDTTHLNLASCM